LTVPLNTIIQGHVLDVLKTMPCEFFNTIVTSPPYWGLRDYGLEPQVWDGEAGCVHEWGDEGIVNRGHPGDKSTLVGTQTADISKAAGNQGQFCIHCNAWLGSFGLEPTPEQYVRHMVQIGRELWRVLRKDGTFWLNFGDSYLSNRGNTPEKPGLDNKYKNANFHFVGKKSVPGLKPKDLCGVPWRVALALQADGTHDYKSMEIISRIRNALLNDYETWDEVPSHVRDVIEKLDREYAKAKGNSWWLRSDIIWSKPNPMPESVTDRPTRAHEYMFLLSKSAKYYFDQDEVKIIGAQNKWGRYHNPKYGVGSGGKMQSTKDMTKDEYVNKYQQINIRSVWHIATQPFSGAHFAVFPEKLVEPCIKAGCPEGGIVLDPFGGSGTVGLVAERLGCNWVLIDLSPEYCEMAERRTAEMGLRFESVHKNTQKGKGAK